MLTPILTTKLYIPATNPKLVQRPRLIKQMNEGLDRKLTLISAPAGFGKTTLVADWIAQSNQPFAWLSLDSNDRDPVRFVTYVIAAIQTIMPDVGHELVNTVQSSQSVPVELIMTALINDIATSPDSFALVLDDYHVLDARPIDEIIMFLLEHLPPQMHVVITTREDPSFSLARMRVRGELTEIRVADLRFTVAEATEFLNLSMGLNLTPDEVSKLEARTEGWIASLQLAAVSMAGHSDTAVFIKTFTGSHRYILDYLVEEVLQSQPQHVVDFLLQTSILDRLSASLCDAVTGLENGQQMLERLERSNMLIFPLDDQRQWYRYHHLFADVLQAHTKLQHPEQLPTWQHRASSWYEQHGFRSDAVRYALIAKDFDRAANLIELSWPVIPQGIQPTTWLGWVKALPDELVRVRPVLSAGYAWTLLDNGELEAAESRLRDVEQWLDAANNEDKMTEMVVANEKEFQSLLATTAIARAYLAQARGNLPGTIKNAQRAMDLLSENDHYWRGTTALFLGMAQWTSGDLESAYQMITEGIASQRKANNHYFQVYGTVILADIRVAQGRLREALSTYEKALQLASSRVSIDGTGVTVNLYVGLGNLYREWNKLETALQHLLIGQAASERVVIPGSEYRLHAAIACIKEAQGDLDSALNLIQEAERTFQPAALPDLRPISAIKARFLVRQGRVTDALEWVHKRDFDDNALSYQHEFENISFVRVGLANYEQNQDEHVILEAIQFLNNLSEAAEAGARTGSLIEILILQALAFQIQEDMPNAITTINRALTLAKPEGYIRVFADEGQPMRTLLAASLAQGADPVFVTRLMRAIDPQLDDDSTAPSPNQLLIEPLSSRELEVLGLLVNGLSNQAIADELVIAISTVKKHVNNIFGKLGVASRTQAVNRARDLNIL
ncbi:MAG: helix-turn-helix transcriptional regulator [Chloroflexi bacterium]|nr:MAG: helix-turn-helix transcriptional regulator [Chloroflexota bacterium]